MLALSATVGLATRPASAIEAAPQPVMTVRSTPGETMDAFAVRLAPFAIDVSMRVSGEICGEFRRDVEGLALDLYTIRRLRHCSYRRLAVSSHSVPLMSFE